MRRGFERRKIIALCVALPVTRARSQTPLFDVGAPRPASPVVAEEVRVCRCVARHSLPGHFGYDVVGGGWKGEYLFSRSTSPACVAVAHPQRCSDMAAWNQDVGSTLRTGGEKQVKSISHGHRSTT